MVYTDISPSQGHTMTLLSSDGIPVEEKTMQNEVDYSIVHSSERYDILVEANAASPSIVANNYWMLAERLEDSKMLEQRDYCITGHRAYALLHYRRRPSLHGHPMTQCTILSTIQTVIQLLVMQQTVILNSFLLNTISNVLMQDACN